MTIGGMENVEVFTSDGKGRSLKATKEFWASDIIFAERAYSAVVFDRYEMWRVAFFSPVGLSGAKLKYFDLKIITKGIKIHVIIFNKVAFPLAVF